MLSIAVKCGACMVVLNILTMKSIITVEHAIFTPVDTKCLDNGRIDVDINDHDNKNELSLDKLN